jgi:hypothetical protein
MEDGRRIRPRCQFCSVPNLQDIQSMYPQKQEWLPKLRMSAEFRSERCLGLTESHYAVKTDKGQHMLEGMWQAMMKQFQKLGMP